MNKPANWTQADLRRAIKVAREEGLPIVGTRIERTGIVLIHQDPGAVDDPSEPPEGPQPKVWPDG